MLCSAKNHEIEQLLGSFLGNSYGYTGRTVFGQPNTPHELGSEPRIAHDSVARKAITRIFGLSHGLEKSAFFGRQDVGLTRFGLQGPTARHATVAHDAFSVLSVVRILTM
jgi:hypothetical protein